MINTNMPRSWQLFSQSSLIPQYSSLKGVLGWLCCVMHSFHLYGTRFESKLGQSLARGLWVYSPCFVFFLPHRTLLGFSSSLYQNHLVCGDIVLLYPHLIINGLNIKGFETFCRSSFGHDIWSPIWIRM